MVPKKLPIIDNTNETMGTDESVCVNTARDHRARKPHGESSPTPTRPTPGHAPRGRPTSPARPAPGMHPGTDAAHTHHTPYPPPANDTRTDATTPQHTPDNAQPHHHTRPHRHPDRHHATGTRQRHPCHPNRQDAAKMPPPAQGSTQKPRCGHGKHHVPQLTRLMLYI